MKVMFKDFFVEWFASSPQPIPPMAELEFYHGSDLTRCLCGCREDDVEPLFAIEREFGMPSYVTAHECIIVGIDLKEFVEAVI